MGKKDRILQIIPAEGWYVYIANSGIDTYPLVCFALIESAESGGQRVEGMYMGGDFTLVECTKDMGFDGYMYNGEPAHPEG